MSIKAKLRRFWKRARMSRTGSADTSATGGAVALTDALRDAPSSPHAQSCPSPPEPNSNDQPTTSDPPGDGAEYVDSHIAKHQYEAADRLGADTSRLVGLASDAWETAETTVNLLNSVASGVKTFARVADMVSDIHPYVHATTAIISAISKPIINQDARDAAFEEMLREMLRTYELVQDELNLQGAVTKKPVSYEAVLLADISRVSEECANFISREYITKNFWSRAFKNTLRGAGVDDRILRFKTQFADLRERWRDAKLKYLDATAILSRIDFARGADCSRDNLCLEGTRQGILRSLMDWIECPDAAQVLFLIGVAGSGKSTVSNTIAARMRTRNSLGAFFAFDRRVADRVPRRLFCTIAYELALWNDGYRDALVTQLKRDPKLVLSTDLAEQWECLILRPAAALASSDPVLLVIDAFDECPEAAGDRSRLRLLDVFTCQMPHLPANFRVLITSRAEPDIVAATTPSQRIDLGDTPASSDIHLYVRYRLPSPDKGGLTDEECAELARAADGLFQWAATACAFLEQKRAGTSMRKRYRANREQFGHMRLEANRPSLSDLYLTVLEATFDSTDDDAMRSFRMILSLVFCATEPLSISTLGAIYSLVDDSQVEPVAVILGSMGAVLEGTSDPSTPIRPMHVSFRDFLLDESWSSGWSLRPADIEAGHRVLGIGTLRLMDRDLTFNMCGLLSPCMQNEDLHDILSALPTGLPYSLTNWAYHVSRAFKTRYETSETWENSVRLTTQRVLFDKFLFWIELLSLAGRLEVALPSLDAVYAVLGADDELREFARDARIFVRFFREIIWASAPHIYLSALPFTPASSIIRRKFLGRFPGVPTVTPVLPSWPIWTYWLEEGATTEQHALIACISDSRIATVGSGDRVTVYEYPSGNCLCKGTETGSRIASLAFSAAQSLIATGHANGLIRLWNSHTLHDSGALGQMVDTAAVHSVVFAPSGSYVVSIHADGFTRLWQPEKRQLIRTLDTGFAPRSIACSHDSLRVYCGSRDGTICIVDLSRTEAAHSAPISCIAAVSALSLCPTRNHLAVGLRAVADRDCIEIWDVDTLAIVGRLAGHQNAVECLAWSPDGRYIASSSRDGTVRLWDAVEMVSVGNPAYVGGVGGGRGVAFTPDGSIVHSCANLAGLHSFSLSDFRRLRKDPTLPSLIAYSTDGQYIKAEFAGSDPTTLYWDARTGASAKDCNASNWRTRSARSHDGRLTLLTVDHDIILRETQHGASVDTTLCRSDGFLGSYGISPDCRRAVVITEDTLRFWDLANRAEIGTPVPCGKWATNPVFSPDGEEVAVSTVGGVRVWRVEPQLDVHVHSPSVNSALRSSVDPMPSKNIHIHREYEPGIWYPGMRLLLGVEPLRIEFPIAYGGGNEWSRCFSG